MTRESLIGIKPKNIRNLHDYIAYCKYYFRPKSESKIGGYLLKEGNRYVSLDKTKISQLLYDFPFIKTDTRYNYELEENNVNGELFRYLKKYSSSDTLKDFPLIWLKDKIINQENKGFKFQNDKDLKAIDSISGTFKTIQNLQDYLKKFPTYSFAIWFKFKLKASYFSRDDDEFYIIHNPILKETNFKVPMIRGSRWKGALAHAFREILNEESDIEKKQKIIESFLRIFGAGSDIVKTIEDYIKNRTSNPDKLTSTLIDFILFELGLEVSIEDLKEKNRDKDNLLNLLKKKIEEKKRSLNPTLPSEFQSHRGRAIFYPTYFDRLSLEVINPHDRRRRTGTQPIYYEVIPKGTEGIFQLVYIPFDGILKPEKELKEEVEEDLKNLTAAIEKLQDLGIGAKTKLGWGRFAIEEPEKFYCIINFRESDIEREVGKKCQIINVHN